MIKSDAPSRISSTWANVVEGGMERRSLALRHVAQRLRGQQATNPTGLDDYKAEEDGHVVDTCSYSLDQQGAKWSGPSQESISLYQSQSIRRSSELI